MSEVRKNKKKKKTYIACKDDDSNTSNNSSESPAKETNFSLIADVEYSKSSVSCFESNDENNYYQLFDAFNELHEEAKNLQYSNKRYKRENGWLENGLKN